MSDVDFLQSIKVTIPGQRALEIQHLKTESIVVELTVGG